MTVTVVWTDQPARLHQITVASVARTTGARLDSLRLLHACGRCGSDAHGRPIMVGEPDVHVSLSRGGDLGVVAIATGHPVGIDVEAAQDAGDVARWVRTESVLKLIGTGLTVESTSIDFQIIAPDRHVLRTWPAGLERPDCVVVDLAAGPGHVAALALAPGEEVVSRRWEASEA